MEQIQREYYLIDDTLVKTTDREIFDELCGQPIYEVIRVKHFVPIFLKEHLIRFRKSLEMSNQPFHLPDDKIRERIKRLIQANKEGFMNLKFLWSDTRTRGHVFIIFYNISKYPEESLYQTGIHTTALAYEREVPNIKIQRNGYREMVDTYIANRAAYEAILVDEDGYIKEGSRSNIFFVKENALYTPEGKQVLLGITRLQVLKICKKLSIPVHEVTIHMSDLPSMEAAIMTGTGVEVMPIRSLDKIVFHSVENNLVQLLMLEFQKIEMEDIEQNRGYFIS